MVFLYRVRKLHYGEGYRSYLERDISMTAIVIILGVVLLCVTSLISQFMEIKAKEKQAQLVLDAYVKERMDIWLADQTVQNLLEEVER